MPWILIIIGTLLVIIGGYLKYQQFQSEYQSPSLVKEKIEDDYIIRTNKFKKINNELEQLIKSIDHKEKMITEKLNNITELEDIVEKRCSNNKNKDNKPYQINRENNFKEIFDRQYQEKEEQINNEEDNMNENVVESINSKYNKIIALAAQNLDAESIAKKLDIGVRETRLILKLYMKEEDSIV